MKTLIILILLIAVAAGAYWYIGNERNKDELKRVEEQAARRADEMKDAVKDKLKDISLSPSDIKQELERTGKVVRKKAQAAGTAIADATADARITAAIKAKLVKDSNLSALRISVSTTDGVVTLSGSVDTPEEISEALKLALDTEGVREAISTLQVKATR
jgi:osmotically-inducible protein OsmY